MESIQLCQYGCGQPATHQFKNGRWCCHKDQINCPKFKYTKKGKRNKPNKKSVYIKDSKEVCKCGNAALYYYRGRKTWWCKPYAHQCPGVYTRKRKAIKKENSKEVCPYCGEKAIYYFETQNTWCCKPYTQQCPKNRKTLTKIAPTYYEDSRNICYYGCGQIGHWHFTVVDRWCCSKNVRQCKALDHIWKSEEFKKNVSKASFKMWSDPDFYLSRCGENSSNWRGGISDEGYCEEFSDKDYREWLMERDDHQCQNPYCKENCNDKINLHHINYDKKDCRPDNFIVVCPSCNSRANFHRKYWERLYKRIRKYSFDAMLMFER